MAAMPHVDYGWALGSDNEPCNDCWLTGGWLVVDWQLTAG